MICCAKVCKSASVGASFWHFLVLHCNDGCVQHPILSDSLASGFIHPAIQIEGLGCDLNFGKANYLAAVATSLRTLSSQPSILQFSLPQTSSCQSSSFLGVSPHKLSEITRQSALHDLYDSAYIIYLNRENSEY